jgi:hypothetical protein
MKITPKLWSVSWLDFQQAEIGSPEFEDGLWVVGYEIDWSVNEPEQLFEAIEILASNCLNLTEQEKLGTGPIEALFANHFCTFSERVFDRAKSNQNIRSALATVIPNDEDEDEFRRQMQILA